VGRDAGDTLTSGTWNIYVGPTCRPSSGGIAQEIVLGTRGGGAVIGKGNNTAFIDPNGGGSYQGNNATAWSTVSDRRLKKNIVDNTEGLELINAIRVRNFEYRVEDEVTELDPITAIAITGVQLGVIAQELEEVCPDCVKEESTGIKTVITDDIMWHMLNAIKQLSTQLDAALARITTLEG
jgi:cytochrome c1